VLSGTLVHIDAGKDVILKVSLLVNGTVSSIVTRSFTYQEEEPEPVVNIPDFCTVNEGEVCAFFEAPSHWSNTVCCWAWCDSPSENFTWSQRKDWPGVDCEYLGQASNGNTVWKWTWDGTKQKNSSATQPAKIIFNNTGQPQTENLDFTQAGYYTVDGLYGVITATAINKIVSSKSINRKYYYTLQGHRLNGRPTTKGVYVHNGKKQVIK
jgi:alpha-amylase